MPGRGAGGTSESLRSGGLGRWGRVWGAGSGVAVGSVRGGGGGAEGRQMCVLAMVLAQLMVRRLLAASQPPLSLMEGEARQASQILVFSLSLSLWPSSLLPFSPRR